MTAETNGQDVYGFGPLNEEALSMADATLLRLLQMSLKRTPKQRLPSVASVGRRVYALAYAVKFFDVDQMSLREMAKRLEQAWPEMQGAFDDVKEFSGIALPKNGAGRPPKDVKSEKRMNRLSRSVMTVPE